MEQSSAQHPLSGGPHAAQDQGLPHGYWNQLDAMYPDPQLQHQQQDPSSQQAPTGISWDHPIFAQPQPQPQSQSQSQSQPQQHHQPQQRSPLPPPTELNVNHGIYSSLPPSWQQNPLQQPSGGYGVSSQFQPHQQLPQYQQGQMSFDSRPLTPSESSSFPSYSYQQTYFHPQQLAVQEPYPERSAPHQQQTEFQPGAPRSSIPQFPLNTSYHADLPTIDLTNDFPSAEPSVSHHTINPQFLDPATQNASQQQQQQQPQQQPQMSNNFIYGVPGDFPPGDGRLFDYYQNNFSVQPQCIQQNAGMPQLGTGSLVP